MEFTQRIERLLSGGKDIDRPTDRCYVHVPTGTELMRTTNYLRGGEKFVMPVKWQGSSLIGTDCDQVCRDYFVEDRSKMQPSDYTHITTAAYNQLMDGLSKVDRGLGEWTIYADRVFLYSMELGVAGEVDLLLVNEKTEEVVIVDMKTVRSPQYMTPNSDKMKKYNKQLNIYRIMAEEMMGGYPVSKLFILPIHVAYPPFGDVSTKADFLEWIEVNKNDPREDIEKLWVKNHGLTSSEYLEKSKEDAAEEEEWIRELKNL